jgi:hypothetical protein
LRLLNKILISIGTLIIGIQFFRPALNKSNQVTDTDISKIVTTSDTVQDLLKNACYDCHSNNTKHIRQGKEELNFSEFGSYSPRKQLSKLNGIANSIRDDIMPLSSYKLMHKNAALSTYEEELLIKWVQQARDSLSVKN